MAYIIADIESDGPFPGRCTDQKLFRSLFKRPAAPVYNSLKPARRELIQPYPYQDKRTAFLRQAAKVNRNTDFVSIRSGQSRSGYSNASATDILKALINNITPYLWNP